MALAAIEVWGPASSLQPHSFRTCERFAIGMCAALLEDMLVPVAPPVAEELELRSLGKNA